MMKATVCVSSQNTSKSEKKQEKHRKQWKEGRDYRRGIFFFERAQQQKERPEFTLITYLFSLGCQKRRQKSCCSLSSLPFRRTPRNEMEKPGHSPGPGCCCWCGPNVRYYYFLGRGQRVRVWSGLFFEFVSVHWDRHCSAGFYFPRTWPAPVAGPGPNPPIPVGRGHPNNHQKKNRCRKLVVAPSPGRPAEVGPKAAVAELYIMCIQKVPLI